MLERRRASRSGSRCRLVDQQAAAGQRRLLAAPARELDLRRAPSAAASPSACRREQRGGGVLRLVPRRERELELERAAPSSRRRRRLPPSISSNDSTFSGPKRRDLDVVAVEVRLEQRLVRHDGGAARGQRGDSSALALATFSTRPEELEVDRADARDHADVRLRDRAELGDLAEPAHAHLADDDLRVRLDPGRA